MRESARISGSSGKRAWLGATAILAYLACFELLLHLLTNGNFRDELYYMAAGERLDLGYVDFPPFVALITALCSGIRRWPSASSPPWPGRWWSSEVVAALVYEVANLDQVTPLNLRLGSHPLSRRNRRGRCRNRS
jgi:hypothetical protein